MFIVDTNILSESTKPRPSAPVLGWLAAQPSFEVSAISLLEIEYGISRLAAGKRRDALVRWLDDLVSAPEVKIVPVDTAIARVAGRFRALAVASGRSRANSDLIIAATAHVTGASLVTRNTKDFEDLGVALLNPFLGPG